MENQTYVCYSMPMRTMGYDHTAYQRKYTDNARKLTKDKTLNRHEYLSGMKRTDHPKKIILMMLSSATSMRIDYNKYVKEEDVTMRSVFDDMFKERKAEGKAEEIVSIYREEGYPDQFILGKLQSKLHIATDQAMEFLANYGKQPA